MQVPNLDSAVTQVGVSLVLSFMVVWDFPTIARGMQSLRSSRLRAVYTEVAPTFTVFGSLFGKALQAQVPLHSMSMPHHLNMLRLYSLVSSLSCIVQLYSLCVLCMYAAMSGSFLSRKNGHRNMLRWAITVFSVSRCPSCFCFCFCTCITASDTLSPCFSGTAAL